MANYHLSAIKSEEGFTFICPKCQARGIAALATSDVVGRHLLICPICRTTLGAWLTSESREWELAALAEKLERSFAYCPSASRSDLIRQAWTERDGVRFCAKIRQLSDRGLLKRTAQFIAYAQNEVRSRVNRRQL